MLRSHVRPHVVDADTHCIMNPMCASQASHREVWNYIKIVKARVAATYSNRQACALIQQHLESASGGSGSDQLAEEHRQYVAQDNTGLAKIWQEQYHHESKALLLAVREYELGQ